MSQLLLAKGTTRLKEVALRTSLGATRRRVFNQFLMESLVLAFLGGIAGIGLSAIMLKVLMIIMLLTLCRQRRMSRSAFPSLCSLWLPHVCRHLVRMCSSMACFGREPE